MTLQAYRHWWETFRFCNPDSLCCRGSYSTVFFSSFSELGSVSLHSYPLEQIWVKWYWTQFRKRGKEQHSKNLCSTRIWLQNYLLLFMWTGGSIGSRGLRMFFSVLGFYVDSDESLVTVKFRSLIFYLSKPDFSSEETEGIYCFVQVCVCCLLTKFWTWSPVFM
jgi:hypothetical protein